MVTHSNVVSAVVILLLYIYEQFLIGGFSDVVVYVKLYIFCHGNMENQID